MDEQNNGRGGERRTLSPAEELYEKWTGFISKVFRTMTAKERFLALTAFVLTGAIAFFAAEKGMPILPYGSGGGLSRPFGDAILCASGVYAPAAFVALVYGTFRSGVAVIPRVVSLSVLFAVRTGLSIKMRDGEGDFWGFYRENAVIKVGSAAFFALFTVGVRLTSLTLSAEVLPEILFMLFLPPLLTAALCGAFEDKNAVHTVNHRKLRSAYGEASIYFLFAVCVFALEGHSFLGCSLAVLSAVFFTVVTAIRGGAVRGGAVGAVLGYTVSGAYAPVMTVTGIFAGVLSGLGVSAAVGLSCVAGCAVAVYAYGYRAIPQYVPEFIIATAVTSPVIRYGFLPDGFPIYGKRVMRRVGRIAYDGDVRGGTLCADMLHRLSEGFSFLSTAPATVGKSGEAEGRMPNVDHVCERLKQGFCDTCPLVCICWDNGSRMAKAAVKMAITEIYSPESVPQERYKSKGGGFKCIHPTEVRQELIRICESPEARAAALPPPPMGFFEDCLCLSEVLGDVARVSETENETDNAATAKARRAVSALGIGAEELAVFGARRKTVVIYGADMRAVNDNREKLTAALSKACGCVFAPPYLVSGECGGTTPDAQGSEEKEKTFRRGEQRVIFKSVAPFKAELACAQRRGSAEERNGDSVMGFTTEEEWFYCILCDGMGSGTEAADCSENAVNTLKKLLECRLSPSLASKLTGNAVKQGYDECFTTLDLLSVDLTSGRAELYKSGAACSFLLRNGEARRLSAPSLPLGISYETVPESIALSLAEGDVLVMISDGLAEEESDEQRLCERLTYFSQREPSLIAERIISHALTEGGGGKVARNRDDMTVAVVKILSTR